MTTGGQQEPALEQASIDYPTASSWASSSSPQLDLGLQRFDSDVVLGVPMSDPGMLNSVRRVIIIATVSSVWLISYFIVDLLRGVDSSSGIWTAITGLFIQLSVPACGYYGAIHTNRQLACCFCSCNLFLTVLQVVTFIRVEIHIAENGVDCETDVKEENRRQCELRAGDGPEKYVELARIIIVVCFGCLAFWFGNTLYQKLSQDPSSRSSQLLVVGDPVSLNGGGSRALDPELTLWVNQAITTARVELTRGGVRAAAQQGWQDHPAEENDMQARSWQPSWLSRVTAMMRRGRDPHQGEGGGSGGSGGGGSSHAGGNANMSPALASGGTVEVDSPQPLRAAIEAQA